METNQNTLMVELFAVLKESLRKQAFSVILLICACGALWWMKCEDKRELQGQITVLTTEVKSLNTDMSACNAERSRQSVEIAMLRERIDIMQSSRR